MEISVINMSGEEVEKVSLSPVFSSKINKDLMHQYLILQLSHKRQGTHKTKTRSEVNRTSAKVYRQKGTGRARHGSRKAPIFVGGGVAHGPTPRKYKKKMPRKMRHMALCSALTLKALNNDIIVLNKMSLETPKTQEMQLFLNRVVGNDKALIVLDESNRNLVLATRNLPHSKTLDASYLNIRDLLSYEKVVFSLGTLKFIEEYLA